MLCSRFLRPPEAEKHGRLFLAFERFFDGMLRIYDWSLKKVLTHRRTTMAVTLLTLVATYFLFQAVPKGFIPSEDTGQILASSEADQGISFEDMIRHQQALAKIVLADPNVEAFNSTVGAGGPNLTGNLGRMFIRLKDRSQRKLNADEVIQQLRPKLAKVPGIQIFLINPPSINIGGRITRSLYQFTLQSPNTQELYRYGALFESRLKALPELQDVSSDIQLKNPQLNIEIDRDKAMALGVSAQQIEDALYTAYGSRQVSTIYTANNAYQVIMELEPEYQKDPSALPMLYIRSSSRQLVPIESVAKLSWGVGPLSVNHSGQLPSVTISFNLKPGMALGDAVDSVEKMARNTMPSTISTSFQGTAQAFQSSLKGLWLLLLLAVLLIYLILGILYESFIHPLTILSGLPSAAIGALVTLLIFRLDLSIYAFVGIIMLVGIVKKNAIMMIDFALEAQRNEGKSPEEAIYQGCLIRFRPIMMTTMAALMGTLPIALGYGAGAEARRPLGLAVVGGLIFSQLLTLYITPVFFLYMESFQKKLKVWFGKKEAHS
jgi:HAE1 family hydrophobic/amphiphilic exporter-1